MFDETDFRGVDLPKPLSAITADVERAFKAKLYYPALVVALTLPEVCSALPMDTNEFVKGPHYRKFLEIYANPTELGLSPMECYRLRGGVVHRGGAGFNQVESFSHVFFTIPETVNSIHGIRLVGPNGFAMTLDLRLFCSAMVRAVCRWYLDNQNHEKLASNLENLISPRSLGGWPLDQGVRPVLGSGPL